MVRPDRGMRGDSQVRKRIISRIRYLIVAVRLAPLRPVLFAALIYFLPINLNVGPCHPTPAPQPILGRLIVEWPRWNNDKECQRSTCKPSPKSYVDVLLYEAEDECDEL